MDIQFTPISGLPALVYAASGDTVTVGGVRYDFAPIPEGGRLPRDAIAGGWLVSDVTREGGTLRLTVIQPMAPFASPAPRHPLLAASAIVDWPRMQGADAPSPELAEWRKTARASTVEFATAALHGGLVTPEEAEAWVTKAALPPVVLSALANIPDDGERFAARLLIRGANIVERGNPFVAMMQAHMALTDAQVDSLFPGKPGD